MPTVEHKKYTPGDKLKIVTNTGSIEGILLQRPATLPDTSMIIKLDSGYNIGIEKKHIKTIELLEKHQEKEGVREEEREEGKAAAHLKEDKTKKTISILHTGGTIAARVDYKTGAVVAKFTPEHLLQQVPELKDIANFRSDLVSNLQSESIRAAHYNLIAKAVEKEIGHHSDGIIVTHGTDTLHYTAAALSFMFENLPIPLILVGAQRSSDRGSSDAFMNLICASTFIKETNFTGVAVCMHSTTSDTSCMILPGTKTRKMHTSRRDAFTAINTLPIAEINYKTKKIVFFQEQVEEKEMKKEKDEERNKKDEGIRGGKEGKEENEERNKKDEGTKEIKGGMKITFFKEDVKVGLLKTHTFMFPEDYAHYKHHDGLIIEGTGLGHAQTTGFDRSSAMNEENKKALAEIAKKIPVVMTSQCINGRVNMNVYSPQRELQQIGVIGGEDMTAETALVKLAWLISNHKDKEEIKQLMQTNLRGEITERTIIEEHVMKL